MNINSLLEEKYEDFWEPLYEFEQEEIKGLEKYLNYICKNLNTKVVIGESNTTSSNLLNFLMHKHISYAKEAYSSLLLGNLNACAALLRIMMENYVTFLLLKKYEKQELWKDYYFWSFSKVIAQLKKNDKTNNIKSLEEMMVQFRNILSYQEKVNIKKYGWLNRFLDEKDFNFKKVCQLTNVNIYDDFGDLSNYIHNNDLIAKTTWFDMTTLTKFVFLIYTYMDKMLQTYAKRFTMRKEYRLLRESLFDSIEVANNFES